MGQSVAADDARARDQASNNSALVQLAPFLNVRESATRKRTVHAARFDLHRDLSVAINGVKMGWPALPIVHGDNDAKEPTQLGHAGLYRRPMDVAA